MAHLGQVYVAAGREADGVPLLEHVVGRQPDRFEALRRSGDRLHAPGRACEGARRPPSARCRSMPRMPRRMRRWGSIARRGSAIHVARSPAFDTAVRTRSAQRARAGLAGHDVDQRRARRRRVDGVSTRGADRSDQRRRLDRDRQRRHERPSPRGRRGGAAQRGTPSTRPPRGQGDGQTPSVDAGGNGTRIGIAETNETVENPRHPGVAGCSPLDARRLPPDAERTSWRRGFRAVVRRDRGAGGHRLRPPLRPWQAALSAGNHGRRRGALRHGQRRLARRVFRAERSADRSIGRRAETACIEIAATARSKTSPTAAAPVSAATAWASRPATSTTTATPTCTSPISGTTCC